MTKEIKSKDWTFKVLNSASPQPSKYRMILYADGCFYYDPEKKVIFFIPDTNFEEQKTYSLGSVKYPAVLYKIGLVVFNFCVADGVFDLKVKPKWAWKDVDPREEKLTDPVKYFILVDSFCETGNLVFPLCDPVVAHLLPMETEEEQKRYLQFISRLKVPEGQIILGLSNLIAHGFIYVDYLIEFWGFDLFNKAVLRRKGVDSVEP